MSYFTNFHGDLNQQLCYICERESELGCFLVLQELQLVKNDVVVWLPFSLFIPLGYSQNLLKGAVSRNSATLGNYKMPVKLREM